MRDEVFAQKSENIVPFVFDKKVAQCFDDMVSRSVPFYREIHRLILELLEKRPFQSMRLYDLGCSTGTTISIIDKHFKDKKYFEFWGVDNSPAMQEKCLEKWQREKVENAHFVLGDLETTKLESAQVVIMNYTLQFLSPEKRLRLLQKIYQSLTPGGIFFMAEKIRGQDELLDYVITDLYYDFKRHQGYSELEISQKREALENVLIPLSAEENHQLLKTAGFKHSEMLFRWYNFASFIGIKSHEGPYDSLS